MTKHEPWRPPPERCFYAETPFDTLPEPPPLVPVEAFLP